MWERRDLKLVGVLALREIILALDREKATFSEADRAEDEAKPELTAGGVCRQNCVTIKVGWMCQQVIEVVVGCVFSCRNVSRDPTGIFIEIKKMWRESASLHVHT